VVGTALVVSGTLVNAHSELHEYTFERSRMDYKDELIEAQKEMIKNLSEAMRILEDVRVIQSDRIAYLERLAHRELDVTVPPVSKPNAAHLLRIIDNIKKAKVEHAKIYRMAGVIGGDIELFADIFDGCIKCVEETQ